MFSYETQESWSALETIFILNTTILLPLLSFFFAFLHLCILSFHCLFVCFHTHTPADKLREFSVYFLMAKIKKKRHRHHCGSRALDSIFNLVRAVSKMPSHSFFTWTQQCENCEILHFSCKHMWVCLPAKVWLCLVGVCNVCKEKGDHGDFHCIIYVNITNGPENLKAIQ